MKTSQTAGNWALLAALTLMWGTTFVFIKIAVASVPPLSMVAFRMLLAAAILGAWACWGKRRSPPAAATARTRPRWGVCIALAVLGNCLPFTLIAWGQQTIDASLSAILVSVMPLGVIVLAHFFIPGERVTARRAAGFAAGFAGVVLLIGPSALAGLGGAWREVTAQVAVVGAALCFAGNAVLARRAVVVEDALAMSAVVIAIGAVLMLPLALAFDRPWTLEPGPAALASLVWMGVGPTAIATVLYFRLIARAGPAFMSLVNYLTPVIGLAVGTSALGERPDLTAYLGLVLILCGIAVSRR
ncbi:MAG: DMT family transporter [Burkholderiales bacterium]